MKQSGLIHNIIPCNNDLFISDWPEVWESLFTGESSHDRPDVVTRIFEMKAREVMKDIEEGGVLGRVLSIIAIVEWQKRGKNSLLLQNGWGFGKFLEKTIFRPSYNYVVVDKLGLIVAPNDLPDDCRHI